LHRFFSGDKIFTPLFFPHLVMKKNHIIFAVVAVCAALIPASIALAAQVRPYGKAPAKQAVVQRVSRRSMRENTYQTRNAEAANRRRATIALKKLQKPASSSSSSTPAGSSSSSDNK
jgi:hypothetical protein